jgi:hypothetical protein
LNKLSAQKQKRQLGRRFLADRRPIKSKTLKTKTFQSTKPNKQLKLFLNTLPFPGQGVLLLATFLYW